MRITTERLVLRPWRLDEAARVVEILGRVDVARWLSDGEPELVSTLAQGREKIAGWLAIEKPLGVWAVEVAATGVPAGSVMLVPIPDSNGLVQIGWNLHPDVHGQGYATEAAQALLVHGHAAGISEIRALTHLDNHPSIGVAVRLGMDDLGVTEKWYDEPSRLFRSTAPSSGGPVGRAIIDRVDVVLDTGPLSYPCWAVVVSDGRLGLWCPTGFDGAHPARARFGEVSGTAELIRSGRLFDEVRGRIREEHGWRMRLTGGRRDGEVLLVRASAQGMNP